MTSVPVRLPQTSSCSMAAARKVSAAASSTVFPCARKVCASFPMVVVFPVPFTPTTRMTSGPSTDFAGFSAALRMASSSCLSTRFSSATSPICLRSTFSRRVASTCWVVAEPRSAASSVASRSSSVERSISLFQDASSSMRSESDSRVRVTASFIRSRKLGFTSVLPNRVWIMRFAPRCAILDYTEQALRGSTRYLVLAFHRLDDGIGGGARGGGSGRCGLVGGDGCGAVQAELAALEDGGECGHHTRVELRAGERVDDADNVLGIHGGLVGTVGRHGVEGVGHRDNARHERDLVSLEGMRITAAIERLVVQLDPGD